MSRSRTRRPEDVPVLDPPLSAAEFEAIYPGLRRYAALVGDADVDPDDLVQDALTAYLRRFAGTVGADQPEAYLRTAVLGLARNHRRDAGRRRRLTPRPDGEGAEEQYPSDVAAVLAVLGVQDRALLVLVDLDGHPVGDAAAIVGVTTLAARARLSRARRRLREHHDAGERT